MILEQIFSGGQTGVDRAALDAAIALGIPCGGWCPLGRLAEDGEIDPKYPLRETALKDYAQRTEWNVRDADGTLILCFGPPSGGTAYTIECARIHRKPFLVVDMKEKPSKADFLKWVEAHRIKRLNVAGPRESRRPGAIYDGARRILMDWLGP